METPNKGSSHYFLFGYILWWGSMVTPAGTPDFGAIVLPVPIPLLYLGSLSAILGNQAFLQTKKEDLCEC
jgi:hypothetical protein